MPRRTKREERRWTASQVVAHNLTRARELRGLTQVEVAERLSRFTGANWTQASVAQAEGSVSGNRVRQFTANELVALARTFDLPILFFFLPPDDAEGRLVTDDAKEGLPWEYLVLLLLGHRASFDLVAERSASWSHVLGTRVTIPPGDALPTDIELIEDLAGSLRQREPLLPEDVLAAVFHGLAARRMRGSRSRGSSVTALAEDLRGVADALDAFNNYRPGTFVDEADVSAFAAGRLAEHDP